MKLKISFPDRQSAIKAAFSISQIRNTLYVFSFENQWWLADSHNMPKEIDVFLAIRPNAAMTENWK